MSTVEEEVEKEQASPIVQPLEAGGRKSSSKSTPNSRRKKTNSTSKQRQTPKVNFDVVRSMGMGGGV